MSSETTMHGEWARPRNVQYRKAALSRAITAILTSTAIGVTSTGYAQDGEEGRSDEIEEIVVRGVARQLRPTSQTSATGLSMELIDTPQSISVITPEMFEITGSNNIYEALDLVPGAERTGSGFGLERYLLRGNFSSASRVNNTLFESQGTLESVALERVEVVRGPATVIYGATGGFGGEINQILKRPGESFSAMLGAEVSSFDSYRLVGDITAPIGGGESGFGGRLIVQYEEWGRPYEVVDVENDSTLISGALSFTPTDQTDFNLYFYHSDLEQDPSDGGFLIFSPDGDLSLPDIPWDNYYFSDTRNSVENTEYNFFILDAAHRFDSDWELKGQAAVTDVDHEISYFFPFGPAGGYGLADDEVYFYTYDIFRTSSDLTLDLSFGGDFELFGNTHETLFSAQYIENLDPRNFILLNSVGLGTININEGGQGRLADGSPIPDIDRGALPQTLSSFSEADILRLSWQILLHPTDRFTVLAGLLYEDVEQRAWSASDPTRETSSYDETVGRLGLTYDLTDGIGALDDARAYISYSEGFQPNLGLIDPDGNDISIPQEMEQWEVGIKADFFDGVLGGSIAIYQQELKNIPVGAFELGQPIVGTVLEGQRNVDGVEIEFVGEVLPGWNIAFNFAYTDTEILDPEGNPGENLRVKTVPRNSAALFSTYEFLEGPLDGLRVGGGVSSKSDYTLLDQFALVDTWGQYESDGYTIWNFNASYEIGRSELYANLLNAFDEEYFLAKENHPGFGIVRGEPRTWRIGLRYRFD